MIGRMFTEHPKAIGMSYAEHGAGAVRIGLTMIGGGIVCLIHALVPGLFTKTGGDIIAKLNEECHGRRDRACCEESETP